MRMGGECGDTSNLKSDMFVNRCDTVISWVVETVWVCETSGAD